MNGSGRRTGVDEITNHPARLRGSDDRVGERSFDRVFSFLMEYGILFYDMDESCF